MKGEAGGLSYALFFFLALRPIFSICSGVRTAWRSLRRTAWADLRSLSAEESFDFWSSVSFMAASIEAWDSLRLAPLDLASFWAVRLACFWSLVRMASILAWASLSFGPSSARTLLTFSRTSVERPAASSFFLMEAVGSFLPLSFLAAKTGEVMTRAKRATSRTRVMGELRVERLLVTHRGGSLGVVRSQA